MRVPIEIRDRHVYLSKHDAEVLFGKGFALTPQKELAQPGEFLAQEFLTLQGPQGIIPNVKIFGPWKKKTQVEIFDLDNKILGINAPFRISGDLKESVNITLIGPQGKLTLAKGTILAKNTLYMTVAEAEDFGFTNGQLVTIRVRGEDGETDIDSVTVITKDDVTLNFHINEKNKKIHKIGANIWGEAII